MQGRTILGVGCVVALVGAVVVVASQKQAQSEPRPTVSASPESRPTEGAASLSRGSAMDRAREAALEAKVAALGNEVESLRASAAEANAAPSTPAASPEQAELDDDALAAATSERMRRQTALLDKTFADEAPDAEWSSGAQQTVLSAYSGSEFEGAKVAAVCKSSLCKIELDLTEAKEPDASLRMLALRAPWQGPGFTRFNTETRRADYYLAREEFELPMVDADARAQ